MIKFRPARVGPCHLRRFRQSSQALEAFVHSKQTTSREEKLALTTGNNVRQGVRRFFCPHITGALQCLQVTNASWLAELHSPSNVFLHLRGRAPTVAPADHDASPESPDDVASRQTSRHVESHLCTSLRIASPRITSHHIASSGCESV